MSEARLLAIYLRDHLAGATAGAGLARRLAGAHRTDADHGVMRRLADDIDEDRLSLLRCMGRLGVRPDPVKTNAARLAERVGRIKLNGRLVQRSPLSDLVELEALKLGVEAKTSLWRTLITVADKRLDPAELDRLLTRATEQSSVLEQLRSETAARLFSPDAPGSDATLSDRRAAMDAPPAESEPGFAAEHTPSATDPVNAEADAPGGEAEGHQPPTRI